MTNIDGNQIAATVIADLTRSFFLALKDKSLDFLSKKYAIFASEFDQYLLSTHQKCNLIRTVITKDKPYEIKRIYVDGYFKCANEILQDNELSQLIRDNTRVVVTGFGGIGKTVFAKRFWISVFEEPQGRIPIFFELRRLNALTSPDLESIVRNSLFPSAVSRRDEIFQELLENGRFIFVLDALDEVTDEKKSVIEEQILSLSFKYPKCGFLVTSRYEGRFESWEQFHVFKAESFNQDQVKQLIDNIDFDNSIKKKFKTEVVEKKFSKHKSFLSTPLLSLMMLMTFSQHGELPEKIHIFYRYAFLTLYSWHDGSKEAFRRERKSGLTIDQFEKVFSIFCMLSYYEFDLTFESEKIISYIERAAKQVDFSFDPEAFIEEAEQAVNLLFREGNMYSFTHRSFQEYFAAFALSTYFPNRVSEIFEHISVRISDDMLSMFYELNPVIAEENFIVPVYEKNKRDLYRLLKITDPVKLLADIKYVVTTVSPVRYRPKRKTGNFNIQPYFITLFGNESSLEKFSEIITTMFGSRFNIETKERPGQEKEEWLPILSKEVERVLKKLGKNGKGDAVRISFDYSSFTMTIWNIESEGFEEVEISAHNPSAWREAAPHFAAGIKRRLVFTKRIYEEVSTRSKSKMIPIEKLLGSV